MSTQNPGMNGHQADRQEHDLAARTAAPVVPVTPNEPDLPSSGSSGPNSETTKEHAHEVGYGRPPKAHQFPPGQSGNPGGKPKKPFVTGELEDVFSELRTVKFGGTERKVSLVAAIILKQCEKALEGNNGSAESIFKKAPKSSAF